MRGLAPHLSGLVIFGGYQAVGAVAPNTSITALGQNHFFTYTNRTTPELAGAR